MLGKLKYIIFLSVLYACSSQGSKQIVDASSAYLELDNGVLLYRDRPFTGNLQTYYSDHKLKSDIEYHHGKKEGYEHHWFEDGSKSVERFYTKGYKSGMHKGWWNDSTLKFQYYFNEKGEYNGVVKEWYNTGSLLKVFNYVDGKEVGRQRLWKIEGTIKANYEVVNGERFGLVGLKKCYTVTRNSDNIR